MKESQIVKDCLEYLALKGIFSWRTNTTGIYNKKTDGYYFHGMAGVSDIIGVLPQHAQFDSEIVLQGVILCIECKTAKGELRPSQIEFMAKINKLGGLAVCVHNVEELDTILKEYL